MGAGLNIVSALMATGHEGIGRIVESKVPGLEETTRSNLSQSSSR